MRTLGITTLITCSIERTGLILFKPFSLKKWLCLLFIAWLCGALGGGGNLGNNYSDTNRKQANAVQLQNPSVNSMEALAQKHITQITDKIGSLGTLAAIILVLFLVLSFMGMMLVLLWLAARFKFVWFNAMAADDASIVEPFKRYRIQGNSFFLFSLAFLSVIILFLVLIGIWVFAIGSFTGVFTSESEWSLMNVISTFFIPGMVLLAGIVLAVIFGVYIENFVIPIMALEQCRFKAGWRRFAGLFSENAGDLVLYIFVLMGLGIVCGIIVFFAALAVFMALLIAAGVIFGIPYLLIVVLLKAKLWFIIFAVLLGIPFVAIAILLLYSINLPFAVFFRSFSLYFLTSLNSGYVPLQLPPDSR